jgi:CRISPR/Cas system CSM-associated protein Csm2 small subunit
MERTVEDKIETQHQLLNAQLSGALRAAEEGLAVDAVDRVNRLARTLELHLTLEEKHYFPERRAAQPDLADEIDRLIEEHGEFRRFLSEAIAKVSEGDASGASEILKDFAEIFHQHERREHDLSANPEFG